MRYLLMLFAWFLAADSAPAQALPSVSNSVTPAAPDTVAAIHRLFVHKRRVRLAALGVNLGLGTASYLDGIHSNDPVGVGLTYIFIVPVFAGTTLGILLASTQYSHRKEARALQAFAQHQLPPRIRQRLKPRYFR